MAISTQAQTQIRTIIHAVNQVYSDYRKTHVWTNHQNFIGLSLTILTGICIVLTGYGWFKEIIPTWLTVLLIAFLTSILHEIEHDLIHELYFKRQKFIYHFMMLSVFIFRPISLNPWIRKYWHHFHHQHSGMAFDIEERGITNGDRLSIVRLIALPDLFLSALLRVPRLRKEITIEAEKGNLTKADVQRINRTLAFGLLPFGVPLTLLWYLVVMYKCAVLFGYTIPFVEAKLYLVYPLLVLLVVPNLIRQFSLHFISSNLHYNGDIEHGNVIQQVQVFNPWWSFPMQWFCFYFGETHAIHHFVVNEPFYLRQLTRKYANKVLLNHGIRSNDVRNILFANRYFHP